MTISSDYSAPVMVNGFSCRNCSEVDQAKRNIDPSNPTGGPFGLNDGKHAPRNHFSAEARQLDRLDELHRARRGESGAASSGAAAAYGAVGAPLAGQFVDIKA